MYEIGDYIVYGRNGVCKVVDIGSLDLSGIDQKKVFYTLQPVYSKSSTVYTPVDNDKIIMRRILTKGEAKNLIDEIPEIELLWIENDKLREQQYKEAMNKYDCREWVKIIKTLYVRKQERMAQKKPITNTDEKYLQAAEDYLYGELSIPLGIPKEEMEEFISAKIEPMILDADTE